MSRLTASDRPATIDEIFQRTFGVSDAEMAAINERLRTEAQERAEVGKTRRSPWLGPAVPNEHSTMNYQQQGISRR